MVNQTGRYVLATAAYNEEKLIEKVILSIVAQTHRPTCWAIVSDGSTDRTDEIVKQYSAQYPFIRLVRITEDHPRNFVAQVHAINTGFAALREIEFDFIGNLDADITLDPDYFARLVPRYVSDPGLGLAGGYIWERKEGEFQPRKMNSPHSVAHAVQLFRRKCLEQVGGKYVPMPYGGPDWQAEIHARLHGWKVQAFEDLKVYHHRPTGAVAGALRTSYREGLMDYSVGSHPFFELFRIARRLGEKPYVLGSIARLWAFGLASARNDTRPVSGELVASLRAFEMARLRDLVGLNSSNRRTA